MGNKLQDQYGGYLDGFQAIIASLKDFIVSVKETIEKFVKGFKKVITVGEEFEY